MKEKLICGIDDSGRGPVIGPMVLAGVLCKESDIEKLKLAKVKDSKVLTRQKRTQLQKKIQEIAQKYYVVIIEPPEIDDLIAKGTNLNQIEAIQAAKIINFLNPDLTIIDCPSPNKKAWKNSVFELLQKKSEVIAEHKADRDFPIVSAASILAKCKRDEEIDNIKERVKEDFGSGYPHDTKTIDFLKKYSKKYPELFRKSWQTYKDHTSEKQQKSLGEYRE